MLPASLNFAYLKRAVSIESVLHAKGLSTNLKKRGDQLFGPCPVHGGDNPRAFVVNLSKNLWHCFTKCHAGGDVVDLVRRLDGKTYRQTAEYLASLSYVSPGPSITSHELSSKKPFRPFTTRLPLDGFTPWLKQKGITPKTARRFEVGLYHGSGFLSDCIGVRLHDLRGRPIGYAGRSLNPKQQKHNGKWKFPPGLPKKDLLYNFHRLRSHLHKALVIVECPWGVMRLAQLNIPAVALLGIHLSHTQHDLLRMVSRVVLMLDGDNAGRQATVRIRKTLEAGTQVRQVNLPTDTDPDDLDDDALGRAVKLLLP
ncbi:MAG: toprim domain-containing protein [Candidatus Binatia bacterium]